MGQIQNSISGLAEKVAMAKTGAELLQPERESKAIKAQGEASTYHDTEVKGAYMKHMDADKASSEAEGEAAVLFDKYGVDPKKYQNTSDMSYKLGLPIDGSNLSENPYIREEQVNEIRQAMYDVNTANKANTIAQNELNFKKGQYETFRKRAATLSKKAKINMPETLSKNTMIDKEMTWESEWEKKQSKGGKK